MDDRILIDWTQPIETLDGQPCEVVETDAADNEFPARVRFPDMPKGCAFWLSPFGEWKGFRDTYAVRNVAARQTTDREDGK